MILLEQRFKLFLQFQEEFFFPAAHAGEYPGVGLEEFARCFDDLFLADGEDVRRDFIVIFHDIIGKITAGVKSTDLRDGLRAHW